MSDNSGSEIGAFFAGFMVGGLIGAAAALLMAPQSGQETRDQIRQRGIELQHRTEDSISDARDKLEALVADGRRRLEEFQQQTKVVLDEGQKQITAAIEETKKAATQTKGEKTAEAKA